MTNTLPDLSGKIDRDTVSALVRIHQVTYSINTPFFVVGATARDILLDVSHGIGSKRATVDIDIAVFIENWDQFKRLKDELLKQPTFRRHEKSSGFYLENRNPQERIARETGSQNRNGRAAK